MNPVKQARPCCYIVNGKSLNPVILCENQLIEAKKDGRRHSRSTIYATLIKDLTFSITKTQILQNKKYKFSLQLKQKNKDTINLIIDGKQDLDYFVKKLSQYGIASGLQQMIVTCQKVGEGSFAEVYKVITNYDSVMALKAFDKKNLRIQKNKLAFQNQIDVMRKLDSKYIASLEGLFETQKNIYLKMEYFSLSLKHYLKKNISIRTQKKIMKQLLEALIEMKLKRIIHRDLKPQNVMIRGKSQSVMQCVVIDFGLATPIDIDKYIFNRCGTPGFLAPQIAKMSTKKDKLTTSCDMFSLGCIFYRILTKKYIFSAANYNQVIEKNKQVQIPCQTFELFNQHQKDLITKMLEKQPSKRIQPQQALRHPYFIQQIDDQDEISVQACDLIKKMKIISAKPGHSRRQSIESMMSSFHQNSNVDLAQNSTLTASGIRKKKFDFKDSCLSFDGPVKGSQNQSKNQDFGMKETVMRHSKIQKRASRFSQIKEKSLL